MSAQYRWRVWFGVALLTVSLVVLTACHAPEGQARHWMPCGGCGLMGHDAAPKSPSPAQPDASASQSGHGSHEP